MRDIEASENKCSYNNWVYGRLVKSKSPNLTGTLRKMALICYLSSICSTVSDKILGKLIHLDLLISTIFMASLYFLQNWSIALPHDVQNYHHSSFPYLSFFTLEPFNCTNLDQSRLLVLHQGVTHCRHKLSPL